MKNPPNPQNSKFLEDLQKASQEIETDLRKKKPTSNPLPEVKTTIYPTPPPVAKSTPPEAPVKPPLERISDQDLVMKIEEIAKEKKRLGEIQKMVQQRIQELNNLQQRMQRVTEERKKIVEELQGWEEKNKKIFDDLKKLSSS